MNFWKNLIRKFTVILMQKVKVSDIFLKKPEGIPEDLITEIKINNGNMFFKMLSTLIEARKSQGNRNVDFKFENILELISPKKVNRGY